jgi:hypothetical protein
VEEPGKGISTPLLLAPKVGYDDGLVSCQVVRLKEAKNGARAMASPTIKVPKRFEQF